MVVRAAVGVSKLAELLADQNTANMEVPHSYDSVYLKRPPAELPVLPEMAQYKNGTKMSVGYLPPASFCHEYLISDLCLVLPIFVVRFELNSDAPELLCLPVCDACESTEEGGGSSMWIETFLKKIL